MIKFFFRIVPIIALLVLQEKIFAHEAAPNDTLEISFPNSFQAKCGENTPVPITVKNFANIKSLSFSLNINGSLLTFVSVGTSALVPAPTANTQGSNIITFNWSANSGKTFPDGTNIFEIIFKPVKGGGQTTPLEFKSLPSNIQALNALNQAVPVKSNNGSIQIVDDIAPVATCPTSAVYYVPVSSDTIITSLSANVFDNCGSGIISNYNLSGATTGSGLGDASQLAFKQGVTNVIYTAKDDAGNSAQCAFQVIVKKNKNVTVFATSPTVNCSDSIVKVDIYASNVKALGAFQYKTVWDTSYFSYKRIENVATALNYLGNGNGNTEFNITETNIGKLEMLSPLQNTSISLPDNLKLFTLVLNVKGKSTNATPISFENIDISDNTTAPEPVPADLLSSNIQIIDLIAPTVVCPSDVTLLSSASGSNVVQVSNIDPVAKDNCAVKEIKFTTTGATILSGLGPASGKLFSPGTTIVNYNVQDYGNNVNSCSFKVVINRVAIALSTDTVSCNDNKYVAKVRVKDFNKIGKTQFSLNFAPTKLQYTGNSVPNATIGANSTIDASTAAAGKVSFNFNSTNGITLNDNDVLFEANFNILDQTLGSTYSIDIADKNAEYRSPTTVTALDSKDGKLTILDKKAPVISGCPTADITINTTACDTSVVWTPITAVDNCTNVTGAQNYVSGANFPVGTTKVTYSFTDNFANKSVCEFNVIVKDKIKPTFTTCPPDTIPEIVDLISCEGKIPSINQAFTDNCSGGVLTQVPAAGTKLTIGIYKVTLTVTDNGGNSATCDRYVKIADKIAPTFTNFPNPKLVPSEAGLCGAKVDWIKPTATDNCDANPLVFQNKFPMDFFNVGLDSIQFIAVDASFNQNIKFLKVKVYDAEPPKFVNCPNGVRDTILYVNSNCNAVFIPPVLKAKDNCISGIFDVTANNIPSSNIFNIGKITLNYIAKDNDLPNQSLCQFNVTVADTVKPIITCPEDKTINTGVTCSANYTLPTATAIDNCTSTSKILITPDYSLNFFNLGTKTVTFTAKDSTGNTSTCKVKITVEDIILPTFLNMPKNLTVSADAGCAKSVTWLSPDANDNCKIDKVTSNYKSGDIFPTGDSWVVYTANDLSGNIAKDSFKITVIDDVKPVPSTACPFGFKDVNVDAGKCGATFKFPDFTDNCTPAADLDITINGLKPSSDFYAYPGTYSLQLKVKDKSNNETTCGVVITIKDNIAPVVKICPTDISVNSVGTSCEYQFTNANPLPIPTFEDLCDGVITKIDTLGFPKNAKFPAGKTEIKFTATDKSGNTATCAYNVIVSGNAAPIVDQTTCKDITVNLQDNKCDTTLLVPNPLAIYTCSNKDSEYFTDNGLNVQFSTDKTYIFKSGVTNLTFTAKSKNGLSATCNFKVTAVDKTPPIFVTFPKDTVVSISGTSCKAAVSWSVPTTSDKCNSTPINSFIISPVGTNSGDEFPVGTTVIKYRATDFAGNSTEKAFKITVQDKITPIIDKCPSNKIELSISGKKIKDTDNQIVNAITNANCDSLIILPKPLTATDNCDAIVLPIADKNIFPIGNSVQTWIATDKSGNAAVCLVNIVVTPLDAPVASISASEACIGDNILLSADSIASAIYTWTGPNSFSSATQKPMIKTITAAAAGKYVVNYKIGKCASSYDSVILNILLAPSAIKDSFAVESGKTLTDKVTTNDLTNSNEAFKVKINQANSNTNAGDLTLNADGSFVFVSKNNFVGETTFSYDICYDNCPDACATNIPVKITVQAAVSNTVTIPTLFTPNDDGINDKLVMTGLAGKTGAKLTVFSQWGEKVYSSDDYKNDWDGTWKSKNLPDGTYYYIFQLGTSTQKGFVNIFR